MLEGFFKYVWDFNRKKEPSVQLLLLIQQLCEQAVVDKTFHMVTGYFCWQFHSQSAGKGKEKRVYFSGKAKGMGVYHMARNLREADG